MKLLKKIEELEKELKNKELHSLYLLYGEEQYLLEQNFKKIQKFHFPRNMGINKRLSRFMSKFDVRFFLIFVVAHFRIISREGDDLCVNQ